MLNHFLQEMGCVVDAPTALVEFSVAGNWIVSDSSYMCKVVIVMLGCTDNSSCSRSGTDLILRGNHQEELG